MQFQNLKDFIHNIFVSILSKTWGSKNDYD